MDRKTEEAIRSILRNKGWAFNPGGCSSTSWRSTDGELSIQWAGTGYVKTLMEESGVAPKPDKSR